MTEIWKDIECYEGFYQVSNMGRVKSLDRLRRHPNGSVNQWFGRILKETTRKDKMQTVGLLKHGERISKYIHRLAATTFIPNPLNKPCVNHIDNNPSNNRIENLEWCTHKENMHHAVNQSRMACGERHHYAKLKEKDVINIRKTYRKYSIHRNSYSLAKKYKVDQSMIWYIVNNRNWKHI